MRAGYVSFIVVENYVTLFDYATRGYISKIFVLTEEIKDGIAKAMPSF